MEEGLVAGRECGSCNACCISLTIDDPELRKAQGYRCRNAQKDGGCSIYESRPETCRIFYCGWRQLRWVHPAMRPDVSHVLIRLRGVLGKDGSRRMGVVFMPLDRAALKAEGFAESVAAAVAADIPVYLNVPGPPGYTAAIAQVNDVLFDAVCTKDRAGVLEVIRRAMAKARSGSFVPITFRRSTTLAGEARGEIPLQDMAEMLGDRAE